MKKLLFILIAGLVGCSGFQIEDAATHKILAYASGKSMAIGINKVRPEVDPDLTNAWVEMMSANAGMETVSGEAMVAFYNHCLMIITEDVHDPYGLIGDLSMLLTIYDAQIAPDGRMTMINPVPMAILQTFEMGYSNGRRITVNSNIANMPVTSEFIWSIYSDDLIPKNYTPMRNLILLDFKD